MKRVVGAVVVALMLLLPVSVVVASGKSEQGGAMAKQKYALMMSHMTNAFVIEFSDGVKAKAKELGVELTVFDGEQDAAKQISQVETAITQGYDGIMIEPVSVDGLRPAVEQARKAGVPIVTVVQRIKDQDLANAYVGADPVDGGEVEMTAAVKAIDGKGKVAFLLGPLGSDGQIGRTQGYMNVLEKYPDIEVVFQQSANWRTDEALEIVENWLQTGTKLAAIVANNDGMALGALKAVQDAHLEGQIKIFGIDALPDAIAAMEAGGLTGTVSQGTARQAAVGMETVYKIVNGETVPPTVIVPHVLVTMENIADFK